MTPAIVKALFFCPVALFVKGNIAIDLHQLAYVSRSRTPLDEALLLDILNVSVRNNERDAITGVLMYHEQLFFQVLEGGRPEIERCYERIENDHRHSGVSLIWSNAVDSRVFPQWAMGFAGPDEIGDYTEQAFRSIAGVLSGQDATPNSNNVALRLAQLMYRDFRELR